MLLHYLRIHNNELAHWYPRRLWKDHGWCEQWRPMNSSIPWNFRYCLMHFSISTWGHQQDVATEPVSRLFNSLWKLFSFQLLLWNSLSNFKTVYHLSRYILLIIILSSLLNGMFTNWQFSVKRRRFHYPTRHCRLACKLTKCEAGSKIIHAFRC